MKDDKKIKTEKIVLNGLVIAGIVLTLLAVLASPFIIVAIIKAGEFSALPPYTWILTSASVYVCAVPYLAALIELKLICSRIFTDKAFSMGTAKKFRNIGICAFAELLIFSVDQAVLCSMLGIYELMGFYYLPVFVFVFVCIVAGVLAFAMSGVFKQIGHDDGECFEFQESQGKGFSLLDSRCPLRNSRLPAGRPARICTGGE